MCELLRYQEEPFLEGCCTERIRWKEVHFYYRVYTVPVEIVAARLHDVPVNRESVVRTGSGRGPLLATDKSSLRPV